MILEGILFAGFGLIIGSFTNVLIVREGKRSILGRSQCPSCGRILTASDLVPIFSWLFLRGRCRYCQAPISLQYPIVEAVTCALFLTVGLSPLDMVLKILGALMIALLVAITVYDLYYTVIPDAWSYAVSGLALAYGMYSAEGVAGIIFILLGAVVSVAPLFALWFVSKGRWMGLGDVKLALAIGFFLGPIVGPASVLFAFILGAFVSVCVLLPLASIIEFVNKLGITSLSATHSRFTMKSEVPFGPFLVASFILLWQLSAYGVPIPLLP